MMSHKLLTGKLLRKVPEVTILFWVIKLLTTALGESTSDYFIYIFNPYIVVIATAILFALALGLQLRLRRYMAWVYWTTVLLVAIFGTMAADVMHVVMGIPYIDSTVLFASILVVVFIAWQKIEGTLSIHSITTRRREIFYWLTVMSTFALGTAVGDLVAYSAHLGFLSAGLLFIGIFAVPVLGYQVFNWDPVFSFWFAYSMTRPLGASFADWTGKAHVAGGLGWGDGIVIILLGLLFIILVGYLTATHEDVDNSPADLGNTIP